MRKYSSNLAFDTFVYCWTRRNGEWYYGIHTGSFDDGYTGSGVKFKNKYCNSCQSEWSRTILFRGSREECLEFEKELVTPEMLLQPDCLNLMEGGLGGAMSPEVEEKRVANMKNVPKSEAHKAKLSSIRTGTKGTLTGNEAKRLGQTGRKHSDESKAKRSLSLSGRTLSEEHRRNISIAARRRNSNAEILE